MRALGYFVFCVLAIRLCFSPSAATAQSNSIPAGDSLDKRVPVIKSEWKKKWPRKIVGWISVGDSALLVCDESGAASLVNGRDGKLLWTAGGSVRSFDTDIREISGTGLAAILQASPIDRRAKNLQSWWTNVTNQLSIVDVGSGEVLWNSGQICDFSVDYFRVFESNKTGLVLGTDSSGHACALCVDILTGRPLWRNDSLFTDFRLRKSKHSGCYVDYPEPLFDTDSTAICFVESEGVRRINLATGQSMWQISGKPRVQTKDEDIAEGIVTIDSMFAVFPTDNGAVCVQTVDGAPLWAEGRSLESTVVQLGAVPGGFLMLTREQFRKHGCAGSLKLIELPSGRTRWELPFVDSNRTCSNFIVDKDHVLIAVYPKLYSIPLSTGEQIPFVEGLPKSGWKSSPLLFQSKKYYQLFTKETGTIIGIEDRVMESREYGWSLRNSRPSLIRDGRKSNILFLSKGKVVAYSIDFKKMEATIYE